MLYVLKGNYDKKCILSISLYLHKCVCLILQKITFTFHFLINISFATCAWVQNINRKNNNYKRAGDETACREHNMKI